MQVSQYPRNADGSAMELMVGVLVDATGNNGARLTNPPTGPDRAPIRAVGLVFSNPDGTPVSFSISDVAFGPSWDSDPAAPSKNAVYDKVAANDVSIAANAAAIALKISSTEKGAVNGVATLDAGGKIPTSQMSPIALTTVQVVASQAAQLALVTQEGDVVVRTDQNKSYVRNAGVAGTMADFNELLTPTDAVLSVAGLAGAVGAAALKAAMAFVKGDVGLGNVDNTSDVNKPVSTAQQTALNLKQDKTPVVTDNNGAASPLTPVGTDDMTVIRALANALTINAPSGAPTQGFGHVIRIKDNGTTRVLTWNAIFRVMSGVTLPVTTTINKTHYVGLIYNATDTKWDVQSVSVEA